MEIMIYPDGWFRVTGLTRNGRRTAHYFFNDKPIHILYNGLYKENVDHTARQFSTGRKCKKCIVILETYSNIGLKNR